MAGTDANERALGDWLGIPERIEAVTRGLGEADLDRRCEGSGMTIRETVHHLAEANLIASNILIAALATKDTTFDWSWVYPGGEWVKRMGYGRLPIRPALELLRSLGGYFAVVIRGAPEGFECSVRLLDAPGAALYSKTVLELLRQEVDHAAGHLKDAEAAKSGRGG